MATQNIAGTGSFGVAGFSKGNFLAQPAQPVSWFYGGVQFPLATSSGNTLLQDADPALFYALDFYAFVLDKYLGPRFATEAANADYRASRQELVTAFPLTTIAYNPGPYLGEAQLPLPLMAIYRVSAIGQYKTVMKSEEQNTWEFVLVLPPMTASQSERLLPILHAAELLLQNRTEQGCDAAYAPPGGVLGEQAWSKARAGLEEIDWVSCRYELFQGAGDLPMPVLIAKLYVAEMQGAYLGFPPFQGAVASVNVFDTPTQTTLANVVQIDTWVPIPPTI